MARILPTYLLLLLQLACNPVATRGAATDQSATKDPFASISKERWLAESARAFAVHEKYPQAPSHVLVISKEPIETLLDAPTGLVAEMIELAKDVAKQEGIADEGFRIVINVNARGGQTVRHLHLHLLGGRKMTWPPG